MNRRSKWMMVVLVAALIGAAPVAARPAVGAAAIELAVATWETVAASGQVEARSATAEQADWRQVRRGDALRPQTLVQTGDKGRATLTRNANLLMLDPSSRVELPGQGFSGMETSVIQTEGSVLYNVDSRINPHFEVVTPYLVAGVKGTSFLVTVNEDSASVTVEHGLVEVRNPASGEIHEVGAGESIIRHRDQLEMDVQDDTRHSRQARKESKRLKRMVRHRPAPNERFISRCHKTHRNKLDPMRLGGDNNVFRRDVDCGLGAHKQGNGWAVNVCVK